MSEPAEFEGKDLADALHQASALLGVPEPEIDYEIVEQGRRGVFGLGAKSVRIRIVPSPAEAPAAPVVAVPSPAPVAPRVERPEPTGPEAEQVERAEQMLRKMLQLSGLRVEARRSGSPSEATFDLSGPDLELLQENDRELLAAYQFLLNRMGRRHWPGIERVQLGSPAQRRRRDDELIASAKVAARQVTET